MAPKSPNWQLVWACEAGGQMPRRDRCGCYPVISHGNMECNKIWKIRHLPFPNFPSILILLWHQGALPAKMGLSVQWGTEPTLPECFYHSTTAFTGSAPLLVCLCNSSPIIYFMFIFLGRRRWSMHAWMGCRWLLAFLFESVSYRPGTSWVGQASCLALGTQRQSLTLSRQQPYCLACLLDVILQASSSLMGLVLTNNLSVIIHQGNELYIAGVLLRGDWPARIPSL